MVRPARRRFLVTLPALPAAASALAQVQRPFPENVELGRLRIEVFPQATLDGRAVTLGPGTRIFDEQNMIRSPSTVEGVRRVAYARGTMGEINRVWLLTDDEHRRIAERIAAARRAAPAR